MIHIDPFDLHALILVFFAVLTVGIGVIGTILRKRIHCKRCRRTTRTMRDPDGRPWYQCDCTKLVNGLSVWDAEKSGFWCPDCTIKTQTERNGYGSTDTPKCECQ